ncbi:hypothetical protein CA54_60640 [Symmachiella macrocystis]|uniref:Uncharacterized protein n=1 Tax=Symmachiella macrocystis TaxID=2527985 RepID=A0A5C6AYI4_9PLAN|nr:hypothetical protein CA54_60640 [Symmachiella macrocystis]
MAIYRRDHRRDVLPMGNPYNLTRKPVWESAVAPSRRFLFIWSNTRILKKHKYMAHNRKRRDGATVARC